jgi:hypothetical protein
MLDESRFLPGAVQRPLWGVLQQPCVCFPERPSEELDRQILPFGVDGEDLYIIDRYETEDGFTGDTEPIIGFTFASDGVPFAGSVMVKKRHEAAIMDMLRSVTVVPDPGAAISVSNPPDVRALTDPNLHTRLYVPSFELSFPLPPDFDKVMTYYGSEDFVCVTFDLTRPPFDEPADYVEPGQISYHPSEINIYLYREMKPSYPGFGEFILFANDLGQYLVYADMGKTDRFAFFDFEAPGIPCGGTVSVRRSFFDTYEDDIRRMLCPREISDWEYGNMLNMSPPG